MDTALRSRANPIVTYTCAKACLLTAASCVASLQIPSILSSAFVLLTISLQSHSSTEQHKSARFSWCDSAITDSSIAHRLCLSCDVPQPRNQPPITAAFPLPVAFVNRLFSLHPATCQAYILASLSPGHWWAFTVFETNLITQSTYHPEQLEPNSCSECLPSLTRASMRSLAVVETTLVVRAVEESQPWLLEECPRRRLPDQPRPQHVQQRPLSRPEATAKSSSAIW